VVIISSFLDTPQGRFCTRVHRPSQTPSLRDMTLVLSDHRTLRSETATHDVTSLMSVIFLPYDDLQCTVAWNSLPAAVCVADSLHSFKCKLKTHLFTLCFND